MESARGHRWIDDTWYKSPEKVDGLWVLRCGAFDIAYDKDSHSLNDLRELHKGLRSDLRMTKAAQALEPKRQELEAEAALLRGILQEFSELDHVPGRCELCTPASV